MIAALALAAALGAPGRAQDVEQAIARRLITLDEAYALSLRRSEAIAQDQESYKQALANVELLRSDILPHLTVGGTETLQQNPHTGFSLIDKTSYPQAAFTLTQPIFSGFREFLAFKAGKRQAESARLTERRAESLLFQDVAQGYFNLVAAQKELAIRADIIDATRRQVVQLEHWVDIGRSRDSELLAAQSQLAQAEAQVEVAQSAEAVDQETLRFLTGVDADFVPQEIDVSTVGAIGRFLLQARNRDDVQAAEKGLEYAQLNTKIVARQRWGTIGATGDYYMIRPGFSQNVRYDGVFSASLPIFDSGQISAQVAAAKSQERSSEQALSLAERSAEHDVRSSYRDLVWALASVRALDKAADLAAKNVDAQMHDYRRNLVTNLDVLTSLNDLQATRLQLNGARQQAAFARAQLEVAAGDSGGLR